MMRRSYILLVLLAALVAGCAQNIVDIPPPIGVGASSYGWNLNSPVLYTSEQTATGNSSSIAITFAPTSTFGHYLAIETYATAQSDTLMLRSSIDSLSISGLTEHSVIKVPSGYSLNRTVFDTLTMYHSLQKVFTFGDAGKQIIVADDSNVVYYSSDAGFSWKRSDGLDKSRGTSIVGFVSGVFESKTVVAAATSGGGFFTSGDGGQTWAPVSVQLGGFTALCSSGSGIYVATSNGEIYLMGKQPIKVSGGIPTSDTTITALAAWTPSNSSRVGFLAGSKQGGLFYSPPDSAGEFVPLRSASKFALSSVRFIVKAADSIFIIGMQAGTDGGVIAWSPVSDSVIRLSDLGFAYGSADASAHASVLLAAENGQTAIAKISANISMISMTPLKLGANTTLTGISLSNGVAFATTTDSGLYSNAVSGGSSPWTRVASGSPVKLQVLPTFIPLEVSLLAPDNNGLRVGATWTAGKMYIDSLGLTLTLRADVARYADSVKLTNGLTFKDVFVVNYALADAGGLTAASPIRWTIYFARSEGPILIDEVSEPSGILLSRAYRSTK